MSREKPLKKIFIYLFSVFIETAKMLKGWISRKPIDRNEGGQRENVCFCVL